MPQAFHAGCIFLCGIVPVHPAKHFIRAALQREVKMRTDLFIPKKSLYKLLRHDPRFQRTEADPFDTLHLPDPGKQFQKQSGSKAVGTLRRFPFRQIRAVGRYMDPGDHEFPDSVLGKHAHFSQDVFLFPAAYAPSRRRNDTVGTELVAAVLDLDISSGVRIDHSELHFLIFTGCTQIIPADHSLPGAFFRMCTAVRKVFLHMCTADGRSFFILCRPLFRIPLFQILRHDLSDLSLFVVAYTEVDPFLPKFLGIRCLYVAAHSDDHGIRIQTSRAMQHLTAFTVCDIRHRTGIYDTDICRLAEGHDLIAIRDEQLLHHVHLIGVDLASQIVQ